MSQGKAQWQSDLHTILQIDASRRLFWIGHTQSSHSPVRQDTGRRRTLSFPVNTTHETCDPDHTRRLALYYLTSIFRFKLVTPNLSTVEGGSWLAIGSTLALRNRLLLPHGHFCPLPLATALWSLSLSALRNYATVGSLRSISKYTVSSLLYVVS